MPTETEQQLLPLCRMIALDHAGRWEREDLEQEAAIGALQAVRRWDPGRGIPLHAYARQRIKGAVLNHMEQTTPKLVTKRQWRAGERDGAVVVFLSIDQTVGESDDHGDAFQPHREWEVVDDLRYLIVEALVDHRRALAA